MTLTTGGIVSVFANEICPDIYDQNFNNSSAAFDNAMSPYMNTTTINGETVTTYEDIFAGVFYDDDGYLNIGLTYLGNNLPDFNGYVIYHQFEYSYNFLDQIHEELT